MKQIISTSGAPKPVGPYNQAVVVGSLVFTAGQIALDPATNQLIDGDIRQQTRQVLENLKAVLTAAGTDFSHVVKTTVFLQSMDDFAAMNDVYAEYFPETAPARSAVAVERLPKGMLVEIECIAEIPG